MGSPCAALLALALATAGCITRTVQETVFEQDRTEVVLRSQTRGGEPIDQGYNHPVVIAQVRLSHILSRLDIRSEGGEATRGPAIPTESLFLVAEGLSQGLAKATSAQEVAVLSLRRTKRFGLFDRNYLTSFVAYVKGEQLYLHLSRSEWEVPRDRMDQLPQPHVGEHPMKFRVLPSKAMVVVDVQSVAVDWRHSLFKRPTRTSVSPTGKVVRRTILMEAPEEEDPSAAQAPVPEHLSATALRRLADLEEQRAAGLVTEAEYTARRLEILRSEADPH